MGVKTITREYQSPFKPADRVDWLLGNVGDWQRMTLDVGFSVTKKFEISDTLTFSDPNKLILNGDDTW